MIKIVVKFIAFIGLFIGLTSCDDETFSSVDATLRDLGSIQDLSNESLDAEMAGNTAMDQEVDDQMLPNDVGALDQGDDPVCDGEVTCDGDGRLRRCEDGEWIVESCPAGMSCDEETAECLVDRCEDGTSFCDGQEAVVNCIDGAYLPSEPCLNGSRCIAGRCLSACETATLRGDYQGCSFWSIDSDNIIDGEGEGPGASSSAVVLSNVSMNDCDILIEDSEGIVIHQARLGAGNTEAFSLPRADLIGTHIGGTAWHISTTQPVLAYQFNPLQRIGTSSVDATLLIPTSALDDSYRVLTWPGQGYNQRGTLNIIAVEEGITTVTIVPQESIAHGIDFRGELLAIEQRIIAPLSNEPWTETLARGDVLNVQSAPFADLSGSLIIADQNLAVFAGTRCSNIPDLTPRCDHLEHQMLPLRNQGRAYIAPGGLPRASEATWYRAVATVDQTQITTIPPLPDTPITLDAGEVVTISARAPFSLNATYPIMLGMFLASADADAQGTGDPSFVLLPPVEQFKDHYVFLTPDDFVRDGLTLIANGEAMVDLDSERLDPVWTSVADTGWRIAHIEIEDGAHEISSTQPFAIIASGYDEEVSYAFTGGLRLEKLRASEPQPYSGLCAGGTAPQTPCNTDELGVCQVGRTTCLPGEQASCSALVEPSDEICNRLDDDCDGLTDESECGQFVLERLAPTSDRLMVTEGQQLVFNVRPQGETIGLDIIWSVDGIPFKNLNETSLEWTPLGFEEGVRILKASVSDGQKIAEVTWLILVNDAPTNTPVIWGRVTMPNQEVIPGLTLELADGTSEGESVVDARGYYAITAESSVYTLKIDSLFNQRPGFPKGIVTLAEDINVDRLNVRRDIELPVARINGSVRTSTGTPLADTELQFRGDCFACSQSINTDEQGNYETLVYYSTWEINATPPPSILLPTRTINDLVIQSDRIVDVIFPQVYTINALVLDQYEQPVSGVTILFDGEEAEEAASSDANGLFTVMLPIGTYLVKLDTLFYPRPPHIGKGIVPLIESLNISEDIDELQLPLPNAWISGTVTGQGDSQVQAGVQLDLTGSCFACSGQAVSDDQGVFAVPLLHGEYSNSISPPQSSDYVNQEGVGLLIDSDLTHDIELEGPALVVSGTLNDPRGVAVSGIGLKSEGRTESNVTTDEQGQFEFRLLSGDYAFKIDTLFGNRPPTMPRGIVEFWNGRVDTDTRQTYIAPFSWINGRVQEAAGDVISNAEIDFTGSCFACSQEASSNLAGIYQAILFQGIYRLDITPPSPHPQQTIEEIDCTELDTTLNIDF